MQSHLQQHQQALLLVKRCGSCAERVGVRVIWGGGACPSCCRPLFSAGSFQVMDVVGSVQRDWKRWRLPIYGMIGISTFLAAFVPLLAPLVGAAGMIVASIFVVRRPLRWLGPARRIATRITLNLSMAFFTWVSLVVSVVLFPLFGAGQVATGVVTVLLAVVYVEMALWLLPRRLAREAAREPLRFGEWALPAAALGSVVVGTVVTFALAGAAMHLLVEAQIPGVADIVSWFESAPFQ